MKKNVIRLNETQLKNVVAESVKKALMEYDYDEFEDLFSRIESDPNKRKEYIKSLINSLDNLLMAIEKFREDYEHSQPGKGLMPGTGWQNKQYINLEDLYDALGNIISRRTSLGWERESLVKFLNDGNEPQPTINRSVR